MTKTLIMATSYVATNDRRELVTIWAKLAEKLNPDLDLVLVDSASPINPQEFLTFWRDANPKRWCYRFPDNVGHRNITRVDGFGRAFCKGVELAIEGGYDYLAHTDSDVLFAKPAAPFIEKLKASGVKVACAFDPMYQFLETAIMFASVPYLKEIGFVEKYDWSTYHETIPEIRFEEIMNGELFTIPLRGLRNDDNRLSWKNFDQSFHYGMDYLTHCADVGLYKRFLKRNGIEL